jgi:outer membrane protein TolC
MAKSLRIMSRGPAWLLVLATGAWTAGGASGQSPRSEADEKPPPASRPRIPPLRRFDLDDPRLSRVRITASEMAGAQDEAKAPSSPAAAALPTTGAMRSPARPGAPDPAATPAPPPRLPIDTTLIPGRVVEPIDLANALRLAGARAIDIAVARQQVNVAMALLSQARSLWLPSLFYGPTWYRADGQVQTVNGPVENVNRNSLYIGGTAALANSFPAPSPGTGYPPLNTLSGTLRISDAIFGPMAARRVINANRAGLHAATNNALLQVAEAYFDLQAATGRLAIAREAAANAEELSRITGSFAQTGQGLEADHRRALAELKRRRREVQQVSGQLLVASANLIRLLVLDPAVVMAPVEPPEVIIRLIPDDVPLDDLVIQGMRARPELANAQELVEAARLRLKQARLRPFVPSLAVFESAGGFGGGQGAFFGNFGGRNDVGASLFWDLRGLGVMDCAIMRQRAAEHETAHLEKIRVQAQVAADVTASYEVRQAASRQIEEARQALVEAIDSLQLNFLDIRQGAALPRATRPIEVLQPIQALAQARLDYLDSVLAYNRAQFRLKRAIGEAP